MKIKKTIIILFAIGIILSLIGCTQEEPIAQEEMEPESKNEMIDVSMEIEKNDDNSFTVMSNLPDGTELILALTGSDYIAQDKVYLYDGKAKSATFTSYGERVPNGEYTVRVTMPVANAQSSSVKAIIGNNGENLRGDIVESFCGSIIVEKEFVVNID